MMFSFLPDVNVSSNPTSPPISSMWAQPMICASRLSQAAQPLSTANAIREKMSRSIESSCLREAAEPLILAYPLPVTMLE